MKLLLDLQAIQGASGVRGIGRYSFEFARAIARNAGDHEVWLGFGDQLPIPWEKVADIRSASIPADHVVAFALPGPIAEAEPANHPRARVSEWVREAHIASLRPDVVHIGSLFEGLGENIAGSIDVFEPGPPAALTLYDLIPLARREAYFVSEGFSNWYLRKLDSLRRATRLLAISRSAKREAIALAGFPEERIAVTYPGLDPFFCPIPVSVGIRDDLNGKYGVTGPFVLYAGGVDPRKNIEGMIEGFAALPATIRESHQLVIVCAIRHDDRKRLLMLAEQNGIRQSRIVFTGFAPEVDLRCLYNACAIFVFPSLHEGFGLPILEAMACGAPAIASDSSSMPEVIGRPDALFDPTRPAAIAAKIQQVLDDPGFAQSLRESGAVQAARFNWDDSARTAWQVFAEMHAEATAAPRTSLVASPGVRKPKLAWFSPLQPQRSGISDYSAELLPELAAYYEIEVIVDQKAVADPWIAGNLKIRDLAWFAENADGFDEVLYNVGNSEFHTHMFGLMERWPGVVILHDFFLSDLFRVLGHKLDPQEWFRPLYDSHGISALRRFPDLRASEQAKAAFPCSLAVFEHSTGVITHSRHAIDLARSQFGDAAASHMRVVPFPRHAADRERRGEARRALGLGDNETLVCSFGMLVHFKLNHRLIEAWRAAGLHLRRDCRLVFVGELTSGPYADALRRQIDALPGAHPIEIVGFADSALYQRYLAAADIAVQLRSASRGETSAAALDCLAHEVALIVNRHGALKEIPDDCAAKIPDDFSDRDLSVALRSLCDDAVRRRDLATNGAAYLRERHEPASVARQIHEAIQSFERDGESARLRRLVSRVAAADCLAKADLITISEAMAANQPSLHAREMLIDVSELAKTDAKSGIQRVVRNLIDQMTRSGRFRPELVTVGQRITYAREFAARHFALPAFGRFDEPVNARPGDIFLGLDLNPPISATVLELLRQRNARIFFVVYDLLPVTHPQFFPGMSVVFPKWLDAIARHADGLICISRAVADELHAWLCQHNPERFVPLGIGVFPLGSQLDGEAPSDRLPPRQAALLVAATARPAVLMVGTIEPRKAHRQALEAFELLWDRGSDHNLVIAGKVGWSMQGLVERIRAHPEFGRRLFWFDGASDAELSVLYRSAKVLLAASVGEGFGLPLVEAGQHGLPLLVRDIPVFREVAGDHAAFFSGEHPEDLAAAIDGWFAAGDKPQPSSSGIAAVTWAESAERLLSVIEAGDWYRTWTPRRPGPA